MIYPALTYLEEIGFASVEAEGNKKLYRITETGAAFLKENQQTAEAMLTELAEIGRRFARAPKAMNEDEGARGERTRNPGSAPGRSASAASAAPAAAKRSSRS